MREILFRGKRKDNGEWVQGNYLCLHKSDDTDLHIIVDEHGIYNPIVPETDGEFTGFTDKNGKMIFEGDIVNYFGKDFLNSLVTFDKGSFWFEFLSEYTRKIRNQKRDLIFSNVSVCGKVIGNIYDNPELLVASKRGDNPAEQLGLAPAT